MPDDLDIGQIFKDYKSKVYYLALSISGNTKDAEDIQKDCQVRPFWGGLAGYAESIHSPFLLGEVRALTVLTPEHIGLFGVHLLCNTRPYRIGRRALLCNTPR